ncbi:MAG: hypothetical protein IKN50_03400, partial [Clostridia bacterium]|nr:hypothetical protein [Clostridia bacterium]
MRSTIFKKITAIIMALSFLAALFSCGRDTGKPVMTLEDKTVTDRMYGYWLSSYKAVLLSQYADASDSDDFWDMKLSEGFSAEDFFEELCSNYIKSNLVAMYLFDVLGLEIEDEDEKTAENI